MNNKKILVILALVFVILLGGSYTLYTKLGSSYEAEQLTVEENYEEGAVKDDKQEAQLQLAPDFTVYDIDGNEVHLSDFIGKPIVLNFWASWCGPCKMEMPDFNEQYSNLSDEVSFLMINLTDGSRETVETASEFVAEQGYSFPVFYDSDMDAAMTYGAYSIPTTYFIDAEGYAVAQATGAIDAETLLYGIDLIR